MVETKKPIDRQRVFWFSDTLAAAQTIWGKQGAAAVPCFSVEGMRRLVGCITTTAAPAAGFPRLRFSADGTNYDISLPLTRDTSQANYCYPFDVDIYLPFCAIELTNGAGGATVRAHAMVFEEGSGETQVGPTPPSPSTSLPATYRSTFSVAAAGAGQFLVLENPAGSGKVLRFVEQLLSKPTVTIGWSTVKQSTSTTGGTSAAVAAVPLDSADAAAVGTVLQYTAVPTPGAAIGTVWRLPSVTAADTFVDTPGDPLNQKPIVLRPGESVALVTTAAATIVGLIEWTESDS